MAGDGGGPEFHGEGSSRRAGGFAGPGIAVAAGDFALVGRIDGFVV